MRLTEEVISCLVTGSGKTTYLKQIAIISIMAHCGMYVPAEQATIPTRDRLCCRIGNADDQEHNISTFMMEMKETAYILNNATDRALVLVDELGRATSNEDGVAIAWATSEYLLKKRAMTFFVTHYPQLVCLASIYPSVQNLHLEASVSTASANANGEINYTHRVKTGACTVSTDYGIELAAACGWPPEVVDEARKTEHEIADLLPYDSVCHEQSIDIRTQAFKVLGAVIQDLKGFITDERAQSFASIRADLTQLQEQRIRNVDQGIVAAMDSLLFRESRQEYDQRIGCNDGVQEDSGGGSLQEQRDDLPRSETGTGNVESFVDEYQHSFQERDEAAMNLQQSDGTSDISSSTDDSSLSGSSSDESDK